ncbi:hypothetical protein CPC08DRAFT_706622 [Agrocybe pediades]|nr:hypothetical protein CPC08DRAFT_706622 [Agrocybe pediades]
MIPSASSMVDSSKAKPNLVMPNGPTLSRKTTSTSTTSTSSLFNNVPDGSSTSSAPSPRVHDTRPNPCSIPQLPSSAISSNQSPGLPTPEMELEKKLSGPLSHQLASNEKNLSALNPETPSSNIPRPYSPEATSSESDFAADSA